MENVELMNMCMICNEETGEVVLQRRRHKTFHGVAFPGGHVELGESIYRSVIREIREETGLTVSDLEICGYMDWAQAEANYRGLVLLFKTSHYTGTLINATEEGEIFWAKLDEFPRDEFAPGFENNLSIYFKENLECHSIYKDEEWQPELIR